VSGFGMLLLGKTQKKHPGHFPPTVPDLPPPPQKTSVENGAGFFLQTQWASFTSQQHCSTEWNQIT